MEGGEEGKRELQRRRDNISKTKNKLYLNVHLHDNFFLKWFGQRDPLRLLMNI
jgi:hypothetical protein